jgi:allophanate hydrolase
MTTNNIEVAVCGAHMTGLPLNAQLTNLGGTFVKASSTSADYKLFKLSAFNPSRPGLLRVTENGNAIALEIWQLPIENYGKFVSGVPAPLGFGTLTLAVTAQCKALCARHMPHKMPPILAI